MADVGIRTRRLFLNLHPMAFAAWFGLLATALNLFPIGQLDGGHISYAVLGKRSTAVTIGAIGVAIGLTYFSTSWLVWTFLLIAMTLAMGPRHPRTIDEDVPLDRHGSGSPSSRSSCLSSVLPLTPSNRRSYWLPTGDTPAGQLMVDCPPFAHLQWVSGLL